MNQKYLIYLFLGLFVLPVYGADQESIQEKQIKGVMRSIGHEILNSVDDCTSRVLPIERLSEKTLPTYRIPFENPLRLDPETIIFTIHQVVSRAKVAQHYFVEVEDCNTKRVVHSYEMSIDKDPHQIACSGRILPHNCYSLIFTIVDQLYTNGHFNNQISQQPLSSDPQANEVTVLKSYLAPALCLLALTALFLLLRQLYSKQMASEEATHFIRIGASKFDQKNGVLSVNDQDIQLSNKEAQLLHLLSHTLNTTITREVLLQKVWADEGDYIGRTLDVFISKLRKKLEADASLKIINIRGVGYKLVVNSIH
ncbi:MAG: winged helix-turn-helix domain-containing protein [Bacteroidota bacterium]